MTDAAPSAPPATTSPSSSPAPRTRRRWLRLALLPMLLYALYFLLANAFLNTPLGPWSVNRKPEKFQMQWGPALSWWPGRVALWDLRLRGQAGRIAWTAQAEKARGRIGLLALARRELHVPWVEAAGVSGAVLRTEQGITPPPSPRPGGWTLRFDRIASDSIRGGRFGDWSLQGGGEAAVGFVKQLRGGPAELLPSSAHLRQARLVRGGDAILERADLQARFSMAPTTREQAQGLDKLRHAQLQVQIDAASGGLELRPDSNGRLKLRYLPGQGQVRGRLALKQQALQAGDTLDWRMPVTIVDGRGHSHRSALALQLAVDRDLHLRMQMPRQADGVVGVDADLRVDGTGLPLRDPRQLLSRASGRVAGSWQFSTLKWLTDVFVDAPWLQLDGAGLVEGDIALVHGVLAPGSRVRVPQVDAVAVLFGNRIEGTASAEGQLQLGADGQPRSLLDVRMQRYRVAAEDAPTRPFVEGNDLRLHLDGSADMARMRDTLSAQAAFRNARVPDLRAYNRYLPNAQLRFDGGAGLIDGDLALDAAGNLANGKLRVRGRGARVQAAGIALRGDVDIDLALRRADLKRYRFDMDRSRLSLRNVSFSDGSGARQGWWGALDLARTRLEWSKGRMSADGAAKAELRNVAFVLDLFARERDFPQWMYKLVDAGQAKIDTRLDWRGETLVLEDLHARNDRFDLNGRLRLSKPQPQGNLYARWGALSMALDLQGPQRKVHVIGAKKWFDAQPAYLR